MCLLMETLSVKKIAQQMYDDLVQPDDFVRELRVEFYSLIGSNQRSVAADLKRFRTKRTKYYYYCPVASTKRRAAYARG
jgi:hypothetical protein